MLAGLAARVYRCFSSRATARSACAYCVSLAATSRTAVVLRGFWTLRDYDESAEQIADANERERGRLTLAIGHRWRAPSHGIARSSGTVSMSWNSKEPRWNVENKAKGIPRMNTGSTGSHPEGACLRSAIR